MSALKLSATASIYYVRSATTTTKPLFISFSNTISSSRNIHQQHSRIRYIPSTTKFPISSNQTKPSSFSDNNNFAGFSGKPLVSNVPSPPQSQPQPEPSKLLTLPTILTLGRVAAVPLLVATFYMDGWRGTTATTTIFIAASFTDWLDGYIARKIL
ncbi:cdp-diacylglycerol-glycerol-3-phosphate 3-phosphatidyltransferase-like protein [Trifolium pratense]|uniref:Cdp-diacylglycerol-glycerol-3-phosphate 3-phosphatidyltransferase-like protein n=1 Tax=Trifolium pratense TaxID=57577 RepID=A0A2K3K3C1_TRIPR|nr:cdp-diacylglycerol-glycerol-3-phosphate 3-phosphatidyltransferase-like protein [Trifolium pratense]